MSFFFNDTATTEIYTLSLHDALPIFFGFVIGHMAGNLQFFLGRETMNAYAEKLHALGPLLWAVRLALLAAVVLHIVAAVQLDRKSTRLNLQSRQYLVCRLLLEKKKNT